MRKIANRYRYTVAWLVTAAAGMFVLVLTRGIG